MFWFGFLNSTDLCEALIEDCALAPSVNPKFVSPFDIC